MSSYYGEISLSKLWALCKQHKGDGAIIKAVTFKDGHTEKFLRVRICETPNSQYQDACIAVSVPQEKQVQGVQYIVGNLKSSVPKPTPAQTLGADSPGYDDEPF